MRVAALLQIDRLAVIGHLHELWWWALDSTSADGDLGDATDGEIEAAAFWCGESGAFVQALLEAGGRGRPGFLERTESGGLRLHDWYDYAGKLLERRAKDRERHRPASGGASSGPTPQPDRQARAYDAGTSSGIPMDAPQEVQGSAVRTVPYPTNRTEPRDNSPSGSADGIAGADAPPPSGPSVDAPYWERLTSPSDRNVQAFCQTLDLRDDVQVRDHKVFARIHRLEKQYGPGTVTEALMSLDVKHAKEPFASVPDAYAYLTKTTRNLRDEANTARPAPAVAPGDTQSGPRSEMDKLVAAKERDARASGVTHGG